EEATAEGARASSSPCVSAIPCEGTRRSGIARLSCELIVNGSRASAKGSFGRAPAPALANGSSTGGPFATRPIARDGGASGRAGRGAAPGKGSDWRSDGGTGIAGAALALGARPEPFPAPAGAGRRAGATPDAGRCGNAPRLPEPVDETRDDAPSR